MELLKCVHDSAARNGFLALPGKDGRRHVGSSPFVASGWMGACSALTRGRKTNLHQLFISKTLHYELLIGVCIFSQFHLFWNRLAALGPGEICRDEFDVIRFLTTTTMVVAICLCSELTEVAGSFNEVRLVRLVALGGVDQQMNNWWGSELIIMNPSICWCLVVEGNRKVHGFRNFRWTERKANIFSLVCRKSGLWKESYFTSSKSKWSITMDCW